MRQNYNDEYEIILHNKANFKLFLVNLLYRSPHGHKDFEIGLLEEGTIDLITPSSRVRLAKGDIFIINPYQGHEIQADTPALILSLQLPPAFFTSYYPAISNLEFSSQVIKDNKKVKETIGQLLHKLAKEYFRKEALFEFRCAIMINRLFYYMMRTVDYSLTSESEARAKRLKGKRARRILQYVDAHYTEKILLSDIAQEENLDLYYLSHLFKETFGIPFQTYVNKLRCEHARHLLLVTDHSLLDICMESGFSDPKYFNKRFKEQYNVTPKQYRKNFDALDLRDQQNNMLPTQEFLSDEASVVILGL